MNNYEWKCVHNLKIASESDIEELVQILTEELSENGFSTYVQIYRRYSIES